jgi:hypothetical protein
MFDELMKGAAGLWSQVQSAAGSAFGPHMPVTPAATTSDPRSLMGDLAGEAPVWNEVGGALPQRTSDEVFNAQLAHIQSLTPGTAEYGEAVNGLEAMGDHDEFYDEGGTFDIL